MKQSSRKEIISQIIEQDIIDSEDWIDNPQTQEEIDIDNIIEEWMNIGKPSPEQFMDIYNSYRS